MATAAVALRPRDRVRLSVAISTPSGGCDLLEFGCGWLCRVYCLGERVWLGTSRDAGVTWQETTFAANAIDGGTAPALCRDRFDMLNIAYHSSTAAYLYRSESLGRSVSLIYTGAGLRFPRPLALPERLLLAAHTGAALNIYTSADFGVTFSLLSTVAGAAEARAELRQDRRGWLHLVYETSGGAIAHRYSTDLGETWSSVTTLAASGTKPGFVVGAERGLLTYWQGTTLLAAVTDETFAAYGEAAANPAPAYVAQQLGALWDRREGAHLLGIAGGAATVVWSENVYSAWSTPV